MVHGNRDSYKDYIRGNCAAADMLVVILFVAIAICLDFTFGTGDINGAFMHSRLIQREVYARPPRDFFRKRGMLWKLLKLPYGIIDAGGQWMFKI